MSSEELETMREIDCPEEPRVVKKKTSRTAMQDVEEEFDPELI